MPIKPAPFLHSCAAIALLSCTPTPARQASIEEILAAPATFEDCEVSIAGFVVEPSVRSNPASCEHHFDLHGRSSPAPLRVSMHECAEVPGLRPDDLANDYEPEVRVHAIVRGGTLIASELQPRCWSKYDQSVLYMRACYEMAGIPYAEAVADVRTFRAMEQR